MRCVVNDAFLVVATYAEYSVPYRTNCVMLRRKDDSGRWSPPSGSRRSS